MTKRIISFLLTLVLLLSFCFSASAEETDEKTPQFYSLKMKIIDLTGTTEQPIEFMIDPATKGVYIRADDVPMLTGGLGYTYELAYPECAIANAEIGHMIRFFYDSTTVKIFLMGKETNYISPLPARFVGNIAWLPFDFLSKSLNFYYTFPNVISPSELTPLTALSSFYTNRKAYTFDWIEEVGYTEEAYSTMTNSAIMVNYLNGLLSFEGGAWSTLLTAGFYTDVYEKEFIDEITHLFVAPSQQEIAEKWDNTKEDGKFILNLSDSVIGGIGASEELFNYSFWESVDEAKLRKAILTSFPQLLNGTKMMEELEKSKSATTIVNKIGNSVLINKDLDFSGFEVAIELFTISNCINDVDNANKKAVEAMKYYGNNSKKSVAKYFRESANTYDVGWIGGLENYFLQNFGDVVMKTIPFDKLLGPAAVLLHGWSILSSTYPYYKNSLASTEKFIYSRYAIDYQNDSYVLLNKSKSNIFNNNNMNEEQLSSLINSGYAYLKFSMIARDAASAAINDASSPNFLQSDKDFLISKLTSKNKRIVKLLSVLDNNDYGFLPSESKLWNGDDQFTDFIRKNGSVIENIAIKKEPILDLSTFSENCISVEEAIALAKKATFYGMDDLPLLDNILTEGFYQKIEDKNIFTHIDEFYVEDYGLPAYVIKLNEEETLFFVPIDGECVWFGIPWDQDGVYYTDEYRVYLELNLLDPSLSDYLRVMGSIAEDLEKSLSSEHQN